MTESTRATLEQLEALHGQLTRVFSKYLKSGDYSAPMLNVIRCFLLNNGVMKDLTQVQQVKASLGDLTDLSVPFLPDYLTH